MQTPRQPWFPICGRTILPTTVALLALLWPCVTPFAQEFRITNTTLGVDQKLHVQFEAEPNLYYYILLRGADLTNVSTAVSLTLATNLLGQVSDVLNTNTAARYYRVQRVLLSQPLDSDGDGIDDIWELNHAASTEALNPLDPTDASRIGSSGRTLLDEYQAATFPLTKAVETSPANGESGVAVTRETIFRFNVPLSPGTVLNTNNLSATFGGRPILSRIELSTDRKKVTLFYQEPLPASARVRVTFSGTNLTDYLGRALDLDSDGLPGGNAIVDFDTASVTPVPGTAVVGFVYASQLVPSGTNTTNFINLPLRNVQITVDGAEQTLRTTTDINGFFNLSPCPAGRFFVHVDGRTADGSQWPGGAFYPFVGKAWTAQAGYTNNIGNIFLPLIAADTLRPLSAVSNTVVSFPPSVLSNNPALAGVTLIIPPNSLFNETGVRGGSVGMAPVPPDRLPEPLPPGLNFPLVVTIQTDGPQNFDRPAPVCFPNLPDPVTGFPLPPGAKTALWSFNHDTGRWEIQGPMTVSADGTMACSDPGVGIRQPGWHGVQPGTQGGAPPPVGPPSGDTGGLNSESGGGESGNVGGGNGSCTNSPGSTAALAYDVTKALFSCTKLFVPIVKGIECGANAVITTIDLVRATHDLATKLNNKQASLDQALAWLELARTTKARAVDLMVCFEDLAGSDKVGEALTCARDLVNAVNTQCMNWESEEQANPGNTNCSRSTTTIAVCDYVDEANLALANASALNSAYQATKRDFVLNALCAALDSIEAIILDMKASRTNNPSPPPLTDPEEIILHRALTEVMTTGEEFFGSGVTLSSLSPQMTAVLRQTDASLAVASKGVLAAGTPVNSQLFYVLTNAATVFRGLTSPQGAVDQIMAPDSLYFLGYYHPVTRSYGEVEGLTGSVGALTSLHTVHWMSADTLPDSDQDGLPDQVEFVVGSNPNIGDTDGDGVSDGAEVQQGGDALSGLAVRTGVIASADTPGNAVDVFAINGLAVVADSEAGVVVFNVSGINPILTARVDTPGNATRVAFAGSLIAVADGLAGLAIVDATDPPAAFVRHQVSLGSAAQAVVVSGGIAYVGLDNGEVAMVDMASGAVIERASGSGAIRDLGLDRETLYVLTDGALRALTIANGSLQPAGITFYPGSGLRLFVGSGQAYASYSRGFHVFDITQSGQPTFVRQSISTQFGWRHVVPTGSGLGVVAAGINSSQSDIDLYDLAPDGTNAQFLTTIQTPGLATAVSIYNGLAYVADGEAGLQVLNYRAFDTGSNAPSITLTASFPLNPAEAEEAKLMRATALVADDVQVRSVEFYLDGVLEHVDGNYPFEFRFITFLRAAGRTNFTLRARAFDTGGNFTWSEEFNVDLLPESIPPLVTGTFPRAFTTTAALRTLAAYFSEPIAPGTLGNASFYLVSAGADGFLSTPDDVLVSDGTISYRSALNAAFLSFAANLAPGAYRATVSPPVADLASNVLANLTSWDFSVLAGTTLAGLVVRSNGTPVAGAIVSVFGGAYTTITGSDGRFTITDVPAGTNLLAVTATLFEANGRLVAQVLNLSPVAEGITDAGSLTLAPFMPPTLSSLAAGGGHLLALRTNGTVWGWGLNTDGQVGDGNFEPFSSLFNYTFSQIGPDSDWSSVAAGWEHSLALKHDGTLWGWGSSHEGQLGQSIDNSIFPSPVQIGLTTDWAAAAAGGYHSLALKTDGSLWAWGGNSGTSSRTNSPTRVGEANDWASVSAGYGHSLGLRADGSLWAWGDNYWGQLGVGTSISTNVPIRVGTGNDWAAVSAGFSYSVAMKSDGSLWAWGANFAGELGNGTYDSSSIPVQIGTAKDWVAVSAGAGHVFAQKIDGSLWAWGSNSEGQFGDGTDISTNVPVQIGTANDWGDFAAGQQYSLARKTTGTLWMLGVMPVVMTPSQVGTANDWKAVAAGSWHSLAVKTNGSLWAWGWNHKGQVGDGTAGDYNFNPAPTLIDSGSDWVAVTGGAAHSHALKANGSLWAWGDNYYGQLGEGTFISLSETPIPVDTSNDWVAVVAGGSFSLALKTNGSLWAWGDNYLGQLGQGNDLSTGTPFQIGVDSDWVTVNAGDQSSFARKADGSLWSWGANYLGQLGNGTWTSTNVPARVGTGNDWAVVSAGSVHTLAVKTNGSLWAWGNNGSGELGTGTLVNTNVPVPVGTASNWVAVAAGSSHSLALKTDGSLWAWGANYSGELGNGTLISSKVPIRVGTANDWVAVTAGDRINLALKTNGSLWGWGNNGFGQLGIGTLNQIGGASNWGSPPPPAPASPVFLEHPQSRTVFNGDNVVFTAQVYGFPPPSLQWFFNGTPLANATISHLMLNNVSPAQAGTYWLAAGNPIGLALSSNAVLTVNQLPTVGEAVDAPTLPWTTGGNAPWSGQSTVTHDGQTAGASGGISDSQESWMETTVTGPGTLTFWWKVSSESGFDKLQFFINGALQSGSISSEVDWLQRTFNLPIGNNILRWRYSKDSSVAEGQDRGWLDQVSFTPQ